MRVTKGTVDGRPFQSSLSVVSSAYSSQNRLRSDPRQACSGWRDLRHAGCTGVADFAGVKLLLLAFAKKWLLALSDIG
ncbi:hypothetical protein BLL52_3790 [Rhodoferax antarcticus ANT.BR]|uniref:Uncharacterized protein n=1 Tax=Rhodoferax antarcticus ANT.BR TaxID=1111071 RepID=A0A1Q8YAY2_9BURK|nr:hypothetical protein BLL52_3790 [Rhodoferax antarcticus ANT.BR]